MVTQVAALDAGLLLVLDTALGATAAAAAVAAKADDAVVLEALLCLRNLVANFPGSRAVVGLVATPPLLPPPAPRDSVLDKLLHVWKAAAQSTGEVHVACTEVLKVVTLYAEARSHLCKAGLAALWMVNQRSSATPGSKDGGGGGGGGGVAPGVRMRLLVELLRNFTYGEDGQVHVLKTPGTVTVLVELLAARWPTVRTAALEVLCNLVSAREAKSHFAADECLLPNLSAVLTSSPSNPQALRLALWLVWSLACDSEKLKAALRFHRIPELLDGLLRGQLAS
ncbi:hypothetical protein HK405_014981, partial [Cladochytrium tenue]